MEAFTPDELDRLLSATDGLRIGPLVRFPAFSGLRRGEALGLRWEDVDDATGAVTVRRSLVATCSGVVDQA